MGAGIEKAGDTEPSPWAVLAPVMDLVTPMAVRVAATLRLADLMREDPVDVAVLAERAQVDPDALGRLLRHLSCHGVFAEPHPGEFAVNGTAELLRTDHPSQMRLSLDLDGFGGQMDLAFTELLHTVKTGEPAWVEGFGAPFWEHLDANPALSASFDATMAAGHAYDAEIAHEYDWSSVRRVVDVGGGTGTLVIELLRSHPDLHATIVDLPETVARASDELARSGLQSRSDVAGQSFFDALPAGGDVYLLTRILHDWGDDSATAVLSRCAEAASGSGRVIIVESHGTSGDDPSMFAEMDLRMLVLCGGRERSIDQYSALARRSGLEVTGVQSTSGGHTLIECQRSAEIAPP